MQGRKAGPSILTFLICLSFIFATGVLPGCITPVRDTMIGNSLFTSHDLESGRIRIINWNIEKKTGNLFWDRDFQSVRDSLNPDILLMQEATLDTSLTSLLASESFGWRLAPNLRLPGRRTFAGVLTASLAKPVSETPVFTDSVEPVTGTPKAALVTEYALRGSAETLLVVNVHAINFVDLAKYESQLKKVESLISSHAGPVILSGDFNTWNGARMKSLASLASRLGLSEVAFSPSDTRTLTRFPFALTFDHIYYRGLDVIPGSPDVLEAIRSSDHFPLVVDFSLPR